VNFDDNNDSLIIYLETSFNFQMPIDVIITSVRIR